MDELRFDGKSVIVTGAGRGFGREHARLLASRGARLVLADHGMALDGTGSDPEPIRAIAKEINDAGGEAIPVWTTVAYPENAELVVQTAIDAYGKLDILINNAGIADPDWFEDQSVERIRRMTDNQYYTVVWMTKAAWPHLIESKGCIVNTASEALLGNVPKAASYCGAKGGVFAFTRAMALDGKRLGIRVNQICPRGNTRLSAPDVLAFHFDAPIENFKGEFFDNMKPEYVSPALVYLAHESCTLTGVTLVSGARTVKLVATIESDGIEMDEGNVTPEAVASGIDQIMDIGLKKAVLMDIEMFND
ncbi:MAG TPA: SDR family NAD(P)-dependent oxidoreductase [Acidimicrobiales bacterium]